MTQHANRPNILYLHSHDTGRFIQPYGHDVPTLRLQRLAEEGILFRQAFAAAPTCSPSRAALLTGQSPHSAGMLGLAHRGFRLNDPTQHIAHYLKTNAGYRAFLCGIQHVAPADEWATLGYEAKLGTSPNAEIVAAKFLQDDAPTMTEPFFLDVGFFETHRAGATDWHHDDEQKGDGRYVTVPPKLPDCEEIRADFADYRESARTLDAKYAVVLDALEKSGRAENTIVLCTTDHGIAFPHHKGNLTDAGLGVLMILRWPARLAAAKVSDALVSHIDIFPTLCAWLDIPKPAWLEGNSLVPVLEHGADTMNREVFGEMTYHAAYEPTRTIRTNNCRYLRRYDARPHPILPNCDGSPAKDYLLARGWQATAQPLEELYDVTFDPNESRNLADDSLHARRLIEMRSRLDGWMRRTNDPILTGLPVNAPAGAVINDVEQTSPREPTTTITA